MDDQDNARLDDDFKRILTKIRPYIINLSNPQYITSCRVWMEKLSLCEPEESGIRNEYLNELYRQMQCGKIQEPFLKLPPDGPLFDLGLPGSSTSWSDISSTSTIATIEVPASGDSQIDDTITKDILYPDLYEKKIDEQQLMIDDLQQKNDVLMKQLNAKISTQNAKAEVGMNMMASEVEYLKERLRELIMMKKNLQASHNAIIMQWEDATRNLEYELRAEKQRNNELQVKIQELESNIDTGAGDTHISKAIELKLLAEHHEEICNIKEKHSEVIKYIEDQKTVQLKQKENDCEVLIKELKDSYEHRIENIQNAAEKEVKFREDEIMRLEKLADAQCDRIQQKVDVIRSQMDQESNSSDALLEKVSFLQNCILKMEKLLRKYEKHYNKKINFLSNELVMKENSMQIQLTTQRAQLLAKASSERQLEIEDIVSQLERRYRQLLEDQQGQVLEIRQDYLNIIKQLMDKFEIKSSAA